MSDRKHGVFFLEAQRISNRDTHAQKMLSDLILNFAISLSLSAGRTVLCGSVLPLFALRARASGSSSPYVGALSTDAMNSYRSSSLRSLILSG